jgi:carboxylesterase type B
VLNDIDTFSRQHHKTSIIINAAKDKTSTNSVEMKRKSITTNTKKSIILEKSVHTTATKGSKSEEDRYIHSSPSSSNIENYIIATSTPNRNDSQQQAKDELFKTTPIKRRSQHQEDDTEYSNEFDYRSSPVRRRLLEEHTNDRERYMTPSPPFTFPQDNNKN